MKLITRDRIAYYFKEIALTAAGVLDTSEERAAAIMTIEGHLENLRELEPDDVGGGEE